MMSAVRRFVMRLRNAVAPGRAERELRRELESHLALLEDEYRRRGAPPEEAARMARKSLGSSIETAKDYQRDARSFIWIDDLRRDTAYALRTLARSPGFTLPAVLTLAIAIGACTAIFTVVDHVLVRSLPMPHADRVVRIYESNPAARRPQSDASPANVADWRRASTTLELVTAIGGTSVTMTGAGPAEALTGMLVGPEFFAITGVRPLLGQVFDESEYSSLANAALGPLAGATEATADAAVIISHAVWMRQLGGDTNVVGRRIRLNGKNALIKAVMPADLVLDETDWGTADCWIPLVESKLGGNRRYRVFTAVGRLKPGITMAAAEAELNTIAARLASEHPADNKGWGISMAPLQASLVSEARATLLIVLTGAVCVMLIGAANIANLMLMRAAGRTREVAVRMAIGAGRSRLVRQWLTESTLVALIGGAFGFLVALWVVPTLVAYAPSNLPRVKAIALDLRVFAFCGGLSLLTGILCGLAPALGTRHISVAAFRPAGATAAGPRRRWLRPALVVTQVALAIVLLIGAGLMTRTLMAVHAIDPGFNPENVLSFGASMRGSRFQRIDGMREFTRELLARLETAPGVVAAGVGMTPLVGGVTMSLRSEERDEPIRMNLDVPSPGYFAALGLRLRAGRFFQDTDTADQEPVAIVNAAFARTAWGTTDNVVGRRIRSDQEPPVTLTVVGLVDDIRYTTLEAEAPPMAFMPYSQPTVAASSNYVVRTTGDPRHALPLVRDIVRSIDPDVPITRLATMEERVAKLVAPRKFNLWLLGVFSIVAVTLAAVGIYGVVSEAVASRTPEIGVRMTLGARPAEIAGLVVGRSLIAVGIGLALGFGVAIVATRWLGSMLFGVEPLDPVTLGGAAIGFAAVAVIAASAPARRATRVDPVIVLRN
jgi:putative ABC transport system permease protein